MDQKIPMDQMIFKLHKISGIEKQYDVNHLYVYTNRVGFQAYRGH